MRHRRRSWPFAAGLALFVAVLGILPHARFSWLIGEPAYFVSAYDEATYTIWAFAGGGPFLPTRWLSESALRALLLLSGHSWDVALVLADLVFPVACALLAWRLTGRLTRHRLLRLLIATGLLFAQELLSLGCWSIWQYQDVASLATPPPQSPPFDLRALRAMSPPWLRQLVPDYASPFLVLFRTPEPQVSLILFLATLTVLIDLAKAARGAEPSRRLLVAGLLMNAVLAFAYVFLAVALVVLEGLTSLVLAISGGWRHARATAALAFCGGLSVLLGLFAYGHATARESWSFPSHLLVLTPASVAATLGLAVLLASPRRLLEPEGLRPIAFACFGTILILTNQQVLTGRMISTRDWERYVDYPLVFLGAALIAATVLQRKRVRPRVLYAFAGSALLASAFLLVKAQNRVFLEGFLAANLKSVAMKRAVQAVEARGLRKMPLVLEDPELAPLLQFRLNRRVNCLLDADNVHTRPPDSLDVPEGAWGRRSPYRRALYEYFARQAHRPSRLARVLRLEAGSGNGFFLAFLFDFKDWWDPRTDGRRARPDRIRALLPEIDQDFAQYLNAGDPCWCRPVVILTRESPESRRAERWNEEFLVRAVVGAPAPVMDMHALLQTPSARDGGVPAATTPQTCTGSSVDP